MNGKHLGLAELAGVELVRALHTPGGRSRADLTAFGFRRKLHLILT
jgi:hypothetical protein